MPKTIPVHKLMNPANQWPQLRDETDVIAAIKLLRIVTDDRKMELGRSTPLVFDEHFNLVGFVHLATLLKAVRHCWDEPQACEPGKVSLKLKDLAIPFAGKVGPEDNIIAALDIMIQHTVSLVPVMTNGKLKGMVRLADIFNEVSALLFDEQDVSERSRLLRDYHL